MQHYVPVSDKNNYAYHLNDCFKCIKNTHFFFFCFTSEKQALFFIPNNISRVKEAKLGKPFFYYDTSHSSKACRLVNKLRSIRVQL